VIINSPASQQDKLMKAFLAYLLLVAFASAMAMPAEEGKDLMELFKRAAAPVAGLRVKRDAACQAAEKTADACVNEANMEFEKQVQAGSDGRSDFIPRKACNFLDAYLDCVYAYLTACNQPENTVNKTIKLVLERAADEFSQQIPGWDGDKCPAFRLAEESKGLMELFNRVAAPVA